MQIYTTLYDCAVAWKFWVVLLCLVFFFKILKLVYHLTDLILRKMVPVLKLVRASRCWILLEIQVSIKSFITKSNSHFSLFPSVYSRRQIFFIAKPDMKALGRQNYLQSAFSTSSSLFCFLTPYICCWLFPHHSESAATKSGWRWDLVLFHPIY